ncbi:hypothetical protein L9F63_017386, partial [Diploptera punctata]
NKTIHLCSQDNSSSDILVPWYVAPTIVPIIFSHTWQTTMLPSVMFLLLRPLSMQVLFTALHLKG